ncbi:MAG: S8 family serine peptidase [Microscillaceae bacterium]|nr:S8 family serine peptidase [Microscillaceae bacterium]
MARINLFRIIFVFGLFLALHPASAQNTGRYFVYLKDKNFSSYSIQKPEAFLSQRAIERRKKQNIVITSQDLPVNKTYLHSLEKTGAKIWYTSRWMNAVMLEADKNTLENIRQLDFVKPNILLLSKDKTGGLPEETPTHSFSNTDKIPASLPIQSNKDYGDSYTQVAMLGADKMHQQGFRGQGMLIAVLDAGFVNAHQVSYFKHLFDNQRILDTYDFVDQEKNVYDDGSHGLMVLSTIAAYSPGSLIGTAPEASFCLFRTENSNSEYRIEEVNWLIAAERADSMGVDVINSSLGYTTFSDTTMDYTYKDLDGKSTLVTQAADLAAATGMLIVNSAGNEGGNSWKYLGAPADADSVLAVGAVTPGRQYVEFSSQGPTKDGRIKPDVSAMGLATVVGSPRGQITLSSGTSFASPLVCGLATGLWQAHPNLSNIEIIQLLKQSANQAQEPDNLLGYGIPDFVKAHELAEIFEKKEK